jgi:hypothetical protein
MTQRRLQGLLAALVAVGAVFACHGTCSAAAAVAVAGVPVETTRGRFSVVPPAGWVCERSAYEVAASRDGALLESVSFTLRKHKKAFAAIKKDSAPDALPEELAENYLADLKSQAGIGNVEALAVEPADLGGNAAFLVRLTFVLAQEMGGVTYQEITLGAPLQDGLLIARYRAPQIHFFDTYLPQFEETLRSLTLAPVKE